MIPTPLHQLAEAAREGLRRRLAEAPPPAGEVASEVKAKARLSVNLKPGPLRKILRGEPHLNKFELAEQDALETGEVVDDALRGRLHEWYAKRVEFEARMGAGQHFHYHCLNIGGLGAPGYGRLCVIDKQDPSATPPGPVWIAWDCLRHDDFWEDSGKLNQSVLAEWIAPSDEAGTLAALKLAQTPSDAKSLPERICGEEDFIEGLCVEGFGNSEIGEIRSDATSSDDHLQSKALRIKLHGATADVKLDLEDTRETKSLARDLEIPWTMIELLASAPDGWAIVQDGEALWLLRPPYGLDDRDRQTDVQVARALVHEDFEFKHRKFDGWGSLCRYLQQERVERATEEELAKAEQAAGLILSQATAEQVEAHLDAIREAIEQGHCEGARDALLALMKADSLRASASLHRSVVSLLEEAIRACRGAAPPTDTNHQSWHIADEEQVARQAESVAKHQGFMNVQPAA